MIEFDISHMMFAYDQQPSRRSKYHSFEAMLQWVEEHISPVTEKNAYSQPVVRKGTGWEIQSRKRLGNKLNKLTEKSFQVISWHIVIEDEQLATMFALKWIK